MYVWVAEAEAEAEEDHVGEVREQEDDLHSRMMVIAINIINTWW